MIRFSQATYMDIVESSGSSLHDADTPQGFMGMILAVYCLTAGGGCHFGTLCTGFTWINLGTSQRNLSLPEGRADLPYVQLGNRLTQKSAFLALLAFARGCGFTWEQPRGSQMWHHPACQAILEWMGTLAAQVFRSEIHLGDFLAPTEKPIWLYSTYRDLGEYLQSLRFAPVFLDCDLCMKQSSCIHTLVVFDCRPGSQSANTTGPVTYQPLNFNVDAVALVLLHACVLFVQVCGRRRTQASCWWARPERDTVLPSHASCQISLSYADDHCC